MFAGVKREVTTSLDKTMRKPLFEKTIQNGFLAVLLKKPTKYLTADFDYRKSILHFHNLPTPSPTYYYINPAASKG